MTQTLVDDPNVKVPAAVRAAADRSNELLRAYNGETAAEEAAAEAAEAANEGQPPVTPEGNDGQPPITAAPQQTETPKATAEDTWEHKYKSVHGRLVRTQEDLRSASAQLRGAQMRIQQLEAAAPPAPSSSTVDMSAFEAELTEAERADYGEDFLGVVEKKARQAMAPVVKQYQSRIDQLEAQLNRLGTSTAQTEKDRLHAKMDAAVPNWREMNTDQKFLDWLGLQDAYSGAMRHDMLKEAYTRGDAARVIAFFNGFLAEEAAVAPVGNSPDVTNVGKVPLKNLAAPGRAKTAAAPLAPAEKPVFTRSQIAAFYADVSAGKYRGREAEKDRFEAEIFSAQSSGRIR